MNRLRSGAFLAKYMRCLTRQRRIDSSYTELLCNHSSNSCLSCTRVTKDYEFFMTRAVMIPCFCVTKDCVLSIGWGYHSFLYFRLARICLFIRLVIAAEVTPSSLARSVTRVPAVLRAA